MRKQGKFIVLDGIDGCGKGTIIKKIVAYLFDKQKTNHIFFTREPYLAGGEEIRKIMKEENDPYAKAEILANLFINKDRRAHVGWIKKELEAGHHVVSDRYKYSTLAYQQTQGMSLQRLLKLHEGMLIPDLVIIPDIPVEEAIRRGAADSNRSFQEMFEKNREFQEKLRQNYLDLPKHLPGENIVILRGESSENIFEQAKMEIDKVL